MNSRAIRISAWAALIPMFVASIAHGSGRERPAPPDVVTTRTLLEEMIDRDAVARYSRPAYTAGQFSSYDRASRTPEDPRGWFANQDFGQFLRVEERDGRQERVMMDAPGPGAVVRIWSANPAGTLRVYLDDSPKPVIEAPMQDVLSGAWKIAPPLAGVRSRGANLYFPIAFARRCVITSDADGFYYHVNHRAYEPGTPVRSFKESDLDEFAPSIKVVQSELLTPPREAAEATVLFQGEIPAGGTMSRGFPFGPLAVRRLWIAAEAPDLEHALRTLVLRMTFDGVETVWCPVGDFFCSGVGFNAFDSWYTAAKPPGNLLISRWTMPYRQRATVTLANLGTSPVTVTLAHRTAAWDWDDDSMHFWARWRHQWPIPTRPMSDWNYVEVSGQGVYVGDVLSVLNPVPEWWGEGDEKITVDGEAFPSHFGTGTEDYYGYAWCSPERFQHAFHGQTRCDGEKDGNTRGYSTVFRTRSLDAIPFRRSIRTDMEVWHWADCEMGLAAATFFYAMPGATNNRPPDPAQAALGVPPVPPPPPPFRIDGTVEFEELPVRSTSRATAAPQEMRGFGRDAWSGDRQLWVRGEGIGSAVEIVVPAQGDGPHRLTLHATRSWDYGIVRFAINGRPAAGQAGTGIDLFSGRAGLVAPTGPIDLGEFRPIDGAFVIRAEVVGGNPESGGNRSFFGLDGVVLTPAR